MAIKKDVLLVFAGMKEHFPRLPMATLTIGAYIREHGFNPILVDLRQDDFDDSKISWGDVLCVGISAMSGPPLLSGIEFAKIVRSHNPDIPIVWGGPHAAFFSEQTAKSRYVDYVIRREGERPFLNLLRKLQGGLATDSIKGMTFVRNGTVVSTPDEDVENIENLPLPAYDLVDMNKYVKVSGGSMSYETSRGCPYRCTFCYVNFFHKRKWRAKSIKKIIGDLKSLVKSYNPKEMQFIGDNLFVTKEMVLDLAKEMIKEGFNFEWNTNARADCLSRFTIDELKLLRKSGCTHLWIGVESGSDKVLKLIKKDITKDQVRKSLRDCSSVGIAVYISLMVGMPGEDRQDLYCTLEFYDEMKSISPKIEINAISVYSPYPGTPMFEEACTLGYEPMKCLEDWAVWKVNDPKSVPWYSRSYRKELEIISTISRFKYFVTRLGSSSGYKRAKLGSALNVALYDIVMPLFLFDAHLRWKYRIFRFAPEWKVFDLSRAKLIKAR